MLAGGCGSWADMRARLCAGAEGGRGRCGALTSRSGCTRAEVGRLLAGRCATLSPLPDRADLEEEEEELETPWYGANITAWPPLWESEPGRPRGAEPGLSETISAGGNTYFPSVQKNFNCKGRVGGGFRPFSRGWAPIITVCGTGIAAWLDSSGLRWAAWVGPWVGRQAELLPSIESTGEHTILK